MTDMNARFLIVNADDFGFSEPVNRGVVRAHQMGIVTSTSLLVRHEAAETAADVARTMPDMGVGLHLDFGEWEFHEGEWIPVYEVVDVHDAAAVQREATRQLQMFRGLTDRNPTHLDSHQHVHLREPVKEVVSAMGSQLAVPVRHQSSRVSHIGSFYGQTAEGRPLPEAITLEALVLLIRELPSGISELSCHPSDVPLVDEDQPHTMYRDERVRELAALCHPSVRKALEEDSVELLSFGQVAGPARIRPAASP